MSPPAGEELSPVMPLHDWLLMILIVGIGAIVAAFFIPASASGLQETMTGAKPRVFWYLGRSSAFVAMGWLWLSMILGLMMTNKLARMWRGGPSVYEMHQFASLTALVFAVFHAFILMGSRFLHYNLLDVLVPFHSDAYRTLWVGLGQLAMYGLTIVGLSFYIRRHITQQVWRLIHYLSFAVFVMVVVHGIFTGTDSASGIALGIYVVSAVSVVLMLIIRIGQTLRRKVETLNTGTASAAQTRAPANVQAPLQRSNYRNNQAVTRTMTSAGATVDHSAMRLAIVFGSQSGNSENLARRTAQTLGQRGVQVNATSGDRFAHEALNKIQCLIIITSTTGDGEPPDNIRSFYDRLVSLKTLSHTTLKYAVLALGDSNYPRFCNTGKEIDARLSALGASQLLPLVVCDVDFEQTYQRWFAQLMPKLDAAINSSSAAGSSAKGNLKPARMTSPKSGGAEEKVQPQKRVRRTVKSGIAPAPVQVMNPITSSLEETKFFVMPEMHAYKQHGEAKCFPATLLRNHNLTTHVDPASAKEIRQVVFSLLGSGMDYEPGDALGVWPLNNVDAVKEMLEMTRLPAEVSVPLPDGSTAPLQEALIRHYDITRLTNDHVQAVAERTGDAVLLRWLRPENAGLLKQMTEGRQLIDLLTYCRRAFRDANDFVSILRKIRPRLYSISSSQKAYPSQAHLTVGVVRYTSHGRQRLGVCSGDLMRANVQDIRNVYVHQQKAFRLPSDPRTPIIMIGPGTGIAPFRTFLQERMAIGATGKSWLFFGCCNAKSDFLYQDELHQFQTRGTLTRLDVAFSRDQSQKVYVQHLMQQRAQKIWQWLDEGAHVYVCGDATRMAKDVEAALLSLASNAGGLRGDAVETWFMDFRRQNRYHRDVY